MTRFIPAPFELFELDTDAAGRRWLPGWQGLVGQPAEEVTLGWEGDDGTQAVVATSLLSRHTTAADRRHNALLLVFAGPQLNTPHARVGADAAHKQMRQLAAHNDAWAGTTFPVDGQGVEFDAIHLDHQVLAAHARIDERLIFVAATITPQRIGLRTLTGEHAHAYSHDPTIPGELTPP